MVGMETSGLRINEMQGQSLQHPFWIVSSGVTRVTPETISYYSPFFTFCLSPKFSYSDFLCTPKFLIQLWSGPEPLE